MLAPLAIDRSEDVLNTGPKPKDPHFRRHQARQKTPASRSLQSDPRLSAALEKWSGGVRPFGPDMVQKCDQFIDAEATV